MLSIPAGASQVTFDALGKARGVSTISVTLPSALGGAILRSNITVYEPANLAFSPSPVAVPLGKTADVTISVVPPLSTTLVLPWTVNDSTKISAPSTTVIEPGQNGKLTLKGLKIGATVVGTNVGPEHANISFYLPVDVVEVTVPTLTNVNPQTGSMTGGTLVTLKGTNLRSDCTIWFDGIPAGQVVMPDSTTAVAVTPPHATGTVDVRVTCGAESFILERGFTYFGRVRSIRH